MSTEHTWLVHSENGETRRVPVDSGTGDIDGVFWAVIAGSDTRDLPVELSAGPLDGQSPNANTQRWPKDQIQNQLTMCSSNSEIYTSFWYRCRRSTRRSQKSRWQ